ncbi:heavy-metal-associated domain-containing protein [Novosphingobium sp.]|uniref:heavy-metal-associated domain-containing protein n=1 Tax=Novosphingobium sp. TaxID=1874826 RepID=UPI00286DDB71|nr:heavy-metal-associated domain-containing protein [Novosphingobium sp.]
MLAVAGIARLVAQIEGDRGINPVATSHDIEISGIEVNVAGKTAEEARQAGWAEARRKAWEQAGGPKISDDQIESFVASIVVEREQIGPRRYIATLGVIFDRARAGQFLSAADGVAARHSAPMLTIPVLYSGGVAQVYEVRGPWQAAWAQYKAATSGIDYVRPSGSGGDSLLLTAGQTTRRSRAWWGNIVGQFEASDVLVPVARLERQWPGGPVRGTFTARYGPDSTSLGSFTLTANKEADLPVMLANAVKRIDAMYNEALARGDLKPDQTLRQQNELDPALAAIIAAAARMEAGNASAASTTTTTATPSATPSATPTPEAKISSITVQFASPDAKALDAVLSSVRSVPGVRGASTSSLAMGGTSVMRVTFAGSIDELRDALRARGWSVSAGGNALSIRR